MSSPLKTTLILFLSFLTSLTVARSNCVETLLPVSIAANNTEIKLAAPRNQQELTDLITRISSQTSNVTSEVQTGKTLDAANTVELAIHGFGFDHSYWNFGGTGSKYNYVEAAPPRWACHLNLRQACAACEVPSHWKARRKHFNRVVGVGHSYGSVTLFGLVEKYGNVLDAMVLTAFAPLGGFAFSAFAAVGWTIASVGDPKRFGSLPSSYMISEGLSNDQHSFFRYGNYEPAVLRSAFNAREASTLGEVLSAGGGPALNYTNPLLIVTGDKDYPNCGGNCYQKFSGVNLVEASKVVFPAVTKFATYIPAETGHGNNLHLSAPEAYGKIQDWIRQL
ncbi:hypothetical protein DFP72DRAFT_1105911 [Ephemerocybe angulata]|uniref:AB hydrolase-1 domain-containing protein n=1 Tax=Ephemerocybe angulata TaxID=980116 RepID=A0A8H6LTU4_9AGAR|nr:hypothetical protein DFP72DRAFT_1105911 [Tulosesus angulatus]